MRKKVGKTYPNFERVSIEDFYGDHWCRRREMPPIPKRFGNIFLSDYVSQERENFISVGTEISFASNTEHTVQDAWFCYPETEPFRTPNEFPPIVLSNRRQLLGYTYEGDVDFLIGGNISSASGGPLLQPGSNRKYVRYPFKVATYFPIRNVLSLKRLLYHEKTESLYSLIKWIFEVTETIGYKYTNSGKPILIGCDPEFSVADLMGERVRADSIFDDPNCRNQVGVDGHSRTGELRPSPAPCPIQLTNNISQLMIEVAEKIGEDKKILTGGGGSVCSLGHHLHFNHPIEGELLELLDSFVGIPSKNIKGSDRRDSSYARTGLDAVRVQPHGAEYRTPASSLIPELTLALHVTGYCCSKLWQSLTEGEEFEFEVDDATGIPTLESYRSLDTSEDKMYTPHLEEMWKWVNRVNGREIDQKRDILHRWVPNREEVKSITGIKVSWGNDIFPSVIKKEYIKIPELEEMHEVGIVKTNRLSQEEPDTKKRVQISISEELKTKINKGRDHQFVGGKDTTWAEEPFNKLMSLKRTYNIDSITGQTSPTVRIGVSEKMLRSLGGTEKLYRLLEDIAKILFV